MSISPIERPEYSIGANREIDISTGLPLLTPEEQAYHDEWYVYVSERAPEGLKPWQVTEGTMPAFSSLLQQIIHDSQAIRYAEDPVNNKPPMPTGLVEQALHRYYDQFPPRATDPTQKRVRIAFQKAQREEIEFRKRFYAEFEDVDILKRSFRDHEHRSATAATFALQTAYAMAEIPNKNPTPQRSQMITNPATPINEF